MDWTLRDLTLFTGAVYGIAWLVTRSKLLRRPRAAVADVPLIGDLVQCIVCTAAWVGLALMAVLPYVPLFSADFRVRNAADIVVLTGWVLASSWGVGRLLGDAMIDETGH